MAKKYRWLMLVAAFALITGLISHEKTIAGNTSVCFTVVNDNVLDLGQRPYFEDNTTYVPYSAFEAAGVESQYRSDMGMLEVTNGTIPVYFDVNAGKVYDALGSEIEGTGAVMRNGQYYLPAVYVSELYGMGCTYIPGKDFDAVRINTGSILSDDSFIKEASPTMWSIYNDYTRRPSASPIATPVQTEPPLESIAPIVPEPTVQPVQTPVPAEPVTTPQVPQEEPPSPSPVATPSLDRSDTDVYISIIGVPSAEMLKILDESAVSVGFFVTADEIRENPETMRNINAKGHSIGILCGEGGLDDYLAGRELLYDAARVLTLLVTSGDEFADENKKMADINDLVYWDYRIDATSKALEQLTVGDITQSIDHSISRADIRFSCGDVTESILPGILQHIKAIKYSIRALREIGNLVLD